MLNNPAIRRDQRDVGFSGQPRNRRREDRGRQTASRILPINFRYRIPPIVFVLGAQYPVFFLNFADIDSRAGGFPGGTPLTLLSNRYYTEPADLTINMEFDNFLASDCRVLHADRLTG